MSKKKRDEGRTLKTPFLFGFVGGAPECRKGRDDRGCGSRRKRLVGTAGGGEGSGSGSSWFESQPCEGGWSQGPCAEF